ncbi:hypothetical protein B296_00027849 [Ensete ventricosum]|uniref:Uncharacterized protein n=1 Tax=Ensete ventricosum TaxID=4639 RepID=A0A427ABT3_ENSVE|nr:hypothetical protein B296_00027849 [Ensete ventricosum]
MTNPLPTVGSMLLLHLPPLLFCRALCRCHHCCHATASLSPATTLVVPCRSTLPLLTSPLPPLPTVVAASSHPSSLLPSSSAFSLSPAPSPTSAGAAPPPLPPSSPSSQSLHSLIASSAVITLVVCGSILGTASPATPPATPLLPTSALPSPATLRTHLWLWLHCRSPHAGDTRLPPQGYPRLHGRLLHPFRMPTSWRCWIQPLCSLPSVTDGAQVFFLTPLLRASLPRSLIYCDQQCKRRRAPLPLVPAVASLVTTATHVAVGCALA